MPSFASLGALLFAAMILAGCAAVETIDWNRSADGWIRGMCRDRSNVDCHGEYQRPPTLRNHAAGRV